MPDQRNEPDYKVERFNGNRHMVAASSTAARRYNTIHNLLEVYPLGQLTTVTIGPLDSLDFTA